MMPNRYYYVNSEIYFLINILGLGDTYTDNIFSKSDHF